MVRYFLLSASRTQCPGQGHFQVIGKNGLDSGVSKAVTNFPLDPWPSERSSLRHPLQLPGSEQPGRQKRKRCIPDHLTLTEGHPSNLVRVTLMSTFPSIGGPQYRPLTVTVLIMPTLFRGYPRFWETPNSKPYISLYSPRIPLYFSGDHQKGTPTWSLLVSLGGCQERNVQRDHCIGVAGPRVGGLGFSV